MNSEKEYSRPATIRGISRAIVILAALPYVFLIITPGPSGVEDFGHPTNNRTSSFVVCSSGFPFSPFLYFFDSFLRGGDNNNNISSVECIARY